MKSKYWENEFLVTGEKFMCFHTANNYGKCDKSKNQPSNWASWTLYSDSWQRIYVDHWSSFLSKHYVLEFVYSFSKWPDVSSTTSSNYDFTSQALRKVFGWEAVPMVLVNDNDSHFAANAVITWLNGIGCRFLFTAPRYFWSNGQTENVIRTFKTAIDSITAPTCNELKRV